MALELGVGDEDYSDTSLMPTKLLYPTFFYSLELD